MKTISFASGSMPALSVLTLSLVVAGTVPVVAQRSHRIAACTLTAVRPSDPDAKKSSPFSATSDTVNNENVGLVLANGKRVIGIPVKAARLSPLQRAQVIAGRMGELYNSGAKFKQTDGYIIGKLNGEIVLAVKPATGNPELLLTVDSNLLHLVRTASKSNKVTREDIAASFAVNIIKALQDQPDIALSPQGQDLNAWAKVQPGFAHSMKVTPLRNSDVQRP